MSDFFDFLNKMEERDHSIIDNTTDSYGDEGYSDDNNDEIETDNYEEDDNYDDESNNDEVNDINDDDFEEEADKFDIIEKSLDYSKSVLKVIRQNFKGNDQKIMLQTLRNTINIYLGDSQEIVSTPEKNESKNITSEKSSSVKPAQTMSEEEWNNLDTESLNQMDLQKNISINPNIIKMNESKSSHCDYNPNLNLGIKLNINGQKEVDLSKISKTDIDDMKTLMGIAK